MEYLNQYLTYGILVFFIVNLINVMLSTVKSIWTVKATRIMATLINAGSYGFYAMIVRSMGSYQMEVVVVVTIISNLIGVYFSMWLLDKFKKDKLWKVTIIMPKHDVVDFRHELLDLNLGFNEYPVNTKMGDTKGFDVFTKNQKDSKNLRDALAKYPQVRYHIAEIGKQL